MNIRIGLVGLGQMGRHHARVLGGLSGVDFVGAADPLGDPLGALRSVRLFSDYPQLMAEGLDAVVLAVPTAYHEDIALEMAAKQIHTLVEKPLAATLHGARRIRDGFLGSSAIGAVGHIERFNPALQELKRRLALGELGRVFSVATERVGPFPSRINDVGVVKDLATHDIDIVTWLTGSGFAHVEARTAHRMGREHEDLVMVIGDLADGTAVSLQVNWLTPTKARRVTVLGERGAFVADLLNVELYLYSNADVPTKWDALARIKGVTVGDMVRYAIAKPEPLQQELEAFVGVIGGQPTDLAGLDQAVEVLAVAERVLEAARRADRGPGS